MHPHPPGHRNPKKDPGYFTCKFDNFIFEAMQDPHSPPPKSDLYDLESSRTCGAGQTHLREGSSTEKMLLLIDIPVYTYQNHHNNRSS